MSRFDDFVERLEAALEGKEGRDSFVKYLQGMAREEQAELLAEAERRDPEGAAELARAMLDQPQARSEKVPKKAGKKRGRAGMPRR